MTISISLTEFIALGHLIVETVALWHVISSSKRKMAVIIRTNDSHQKK